MVFQSKRKTDWGEGINFDGEHSIPVREFFASNARYWIDEFHLDGLRLDATQEIHDESPKHILNEIARATRAAAGNRTIMLIAENEAQHTILARPEPLADTVLTLFGMTTFITARWWRLPVAMKLTTQTIWEERKSSSRLLSMAISFKDSGTNGSLRPAARRLLAYRRRPLSTSSRTMTRSLTRREASGLICLRHRESTAR